MVSTPLLAFGITHLTDARYFAAWDARYLCFPLGPAGLSTDYFLAIREWVEGPVCVAELGADAGAEYSAEALSDGGISHVLIDYGSPATGFTAAGITVLTRLPVAGYHSLDDLQERMAETSGALILDFTDGGITYSDLVNGSPFPLSELSALIGDGEVFLHLDLSASQAEATATANYGLALRGSSEEKVGYKSFDDLDEILEALE
ncbi:phosphoribosylanthranilate isomerase [Lewinella marina]|uniref:Uncharacterized protein n=1 Tax=Neolewinella marina TaxID=438751 RepID=A0A2G0CEP0_9BACT|nr:hypothetical protein [Neolewinella marina]NJB87230.1 phosphoribosylanthranilate isomerase [Neolewinella marina]PHK98443.1 hypothetical protein CGL56_12185 [Neolewinella marina]